jgi:hypothetical protein
LACISGRISVISSSRRLPPFARSKHPSLCGERYEHLSDRQALRAGYVASSLALGGRRVAVQRPRARSVAGRELGLASWREWSARDPLEQRAVEQIVLGVSTRGYARLLEPLPEAVAVRSISKSAVSERFVYGTERKRAELMSRDLRQLRVVALLIDGVSLGAIRLTRRNSQILRDPSRSLDAVAPDARVSSPQEERRGIGRSNNPLLSQTCALEIGHCGS